MKDNVPKEVKEERLQRLNKVVNKYARENNEKYLSVDGVVYELTMIDDPMELHEHIEIYLKYVGGGLSGGKVFG